MSHRPGQLENYAIQEQYNPRTGNWLSDTKDILLRFLQDLFFQMPQGQGSYHFEPGHEKGSTDEENTELIISDAGSLNTDSVESRPAIIISRGAFAYGNTSMDQLLKMNPGISASKRVHTDLLSGSFVLNCISRTGLEAEEIALIAMKAIRTYRRELQKAGFFFIGAQVQVGSESPAGSLVSGDSAEDYVKVAVSFPVFYQETWTVQKDALIVKSISLKAEYVAKQFDGSLLNPGSVDSQGNPIPGADGILIGAWTI